MRSSRLTGGGFCGLYDTRNHLPAADNRPGCQASGEEPGVLPLDSETAVSEVTYDCGQESEPMKTAYHPDTHQPITAAADAPPQAICPRCGGPVTLRCRRRMDGTAVYF